MSRRSQRNQRTSPQQKQSMSPALQSPPVASSQSVSQRQPKKTKWRVVKGLKWVVPALSAFSDVWFILAFTIAAMVFDVHFHEVLLHGCFAAATFAVVRFGEYKEKKRELVELYELLSFTKDEGLSTIFKDLKDEYDDWHAVFQILYFFAFGAWFVVAVCVARAMRDCTNAMIVESHGTVGHLHRFWESEYWSLPDTNPTPLCIAGTLAGISFFSATILTILCRKREVSLDSTNVFRRLVEEEVR